MASRVFLLAVVTAGFAIVWSGDQKSQSDALAALQKNRASGFAGADHGRRRLPGQIRQARAVFASAANAARDAVPVPASLAPGAYRLIRQNGAAEEILVTEADVHDLGSRLVESFPRLVEIARDGQRWFLIRQSAAPTNLSAVRMSLDDGGRRPIRR